MPIVLSTKSGSWKLKQDDVATQVFVSKNIQQCKKDNNIA